ncbi:MAG: hypothetical protein ACREDO_08440 [Methyloceanibacter sp.]
MQFANAAAVPTATLLLAATVPVYAEEICPGDPFGVSACAPSSELAKDLMRRRVERTLSTNPANDRMNRLNATGPNAATTPFAMTPDGDNTNFKTSLTQWGSSLSAADKAALQAAKTAAGEDLPLPKAVRPIEPSFDVWAKGRRELFTQNGDVTKEGDALTTFVGADYRVRKNFLVGGMLQVDESRQTILAAPDAVDGTAYLAGPYMTYRLTPNIVADAKAAWGTAHDSAIVGEENMNFAVARMLSEAKVSGSWGWNNWQFSQIGAVTYLDESSVGIAGTPGTSVDVARLSIGPEFKRRIDAGDDNSLEPFAFIKSSLDLSGVGLTAPTAQNTVGGGLNFVKPDHYNISATADYTESSNAAIPGVTTSKVKVSVPSRLLGF